MNCFKKNTAYLSYVALEDKWISSMTDSWSRDILVLHYLLISDGKTIKHDGIRSITSYIAKNLKIFGVLCSFSEQSINSDSSKRKYERTVICLWSFMILKINFFFKIVPTLDYMLRFSVKNCWQDSKVYNRIQLYLLLRNRLKILETKK